jgi:hypothetical protein
MITIETPFVLFAEDYHEFEGVAHTLKSISNDQGIKFKEFPPAGWPERCPYAAVFYTYKEEKKVEKILDRHKEAHKEGKFLDEF